MVKAATNTDPEGKSPALLQEGLQIKPGEIYMQRSDISYHQRAPFND